MKTKHRRRKGARDQPNYPRSYKPCQPAALILRVLTPEEIALIPVTNNRTFSLKVLSAYSGLIGDFNSAESKRLLNNLARMIGKGHEVKEVTAYPISRLGMPRWECVIKISNWGADLSRLERYMFI